MTTVGPRTNLLSGWFVCQDGDTFKVAAFYKPYFYVGITEDRFIPEVTQLLQRKFDQVGAWQARGGRRHDVEAGSSESCCALSCA